MHKLVVYGTLKRGFGNHRLLEDATFVGKGLTKKKFAMYRLGIPFVTSLEEISNIHVEVYEVDDDQRRRIDSLEGHPDWYKRSPVEVILENGSEIEGELYFYNSPSVRNLNLVEDGNYL